MPRRWGIDQRYFAPALITCVLLGGQLTFGFLESWTRTFLAIATAIDETGSPTAPTTSGRSRCAANASIHA